jgi:hypothetical protein
MARPGPSTPPIGEEIRDEYRNVQLERIRAIVEAHYLLGAAAGDPAADELTESTIIDLASFIVAAETGQALTGGLEEARAILERATPTQYRSAVDSLATDLFPAADARLLSPEQEKSLYRSMFGSDPKVITPKKYKDPQKFTRKNTVTLVEEVVASLVRKTGTEDPEVIREFERIVLQTLFSNWTTLPNGSLVEGAAPDLSNIVGPIFVDIFDDEFELRSKELDLDPSDLLQVWKLESILDSMFANKFITPQQKNLVKQTLGQFPDEPSEGYDEDVIAFIDQIITFIASDTAGALEDLESAGDGTLAEAYDRKLEADQKLDPLDSKRQLHPLGFDPTLERQRQFYDKAFEAFGDPDKKPAKAIEDLMRLYDADVRTIDRDDPPLIKAINRVKKPFIEKLARRIQLAKNQGNTPDEIIAEFAPEIRDFVESGTYQGRVDQEHANIQNEPETDLAKHKTFVENEFFRVTGRELADFPELFADLTSRTGGVGKDSVKAYMDENAQTLLDEAKATKWGKGATERGIKALADYLRSQNIPRSTLSPTDLLMLEKFGSLEELKAYFESPWPGDQPPVTTDLPSFGGPLGFGGIFRQDALPTEKPLTPRELGKLHLEQYQERYIAEKEEEKLTQKNIPAVTENELRALITNAAVGKDGRLIFDPTELSSWDWSELMAAIAIPEFTRAQQTRLAQSVGIRLIKERRVTIAAQEAAEREEPGVARETILKVLADNDIGKLPDDQLKNLEDWLEEYGVEAVQLWVEDNVAALKDESAQFEKEEAAADFETKEARGLIENELGKGGYLTTDIDPRAMAGLIADYVARVKDGESSADVLELVIKPQFPDLAVAYQEAQSFTKATEDLVQVGLRIARDMGLIGPTTSPEFLQHFTDYTIPQIANAASLSGFTTTEELQGFFETEFDPGKSTLGLLPGDVDSSAFVQQYGPTPPSISGFASPEGVEGPPSAPLRLRPEQPIPESAFLPFMREAAGDDPQFFQYMIGQTPELVEGFGTAKDELRHRLSLANLQQQTAFAQTPSRLGPLEERLARHHTAAEGIEFIEGLPGSSTSPGFDTAVQQGFLSSKELKALQAGIER